MSVFEQPAATNQEAAAPQEPAVTPVTPAQPSSDVSALIEQNSKLAKSKEHADLHITKLEEQIRQQAEDLQKAANTHSSIEDIKQELNSFKVPHQDTPVGLGEDDVIRVLKEREASHLAASNIAKVDSEMSKAFGNKASEIVQAKAKELGMNMDSLKAMASESPAAFLGLVNPQRAQGSVDLTNSTVNAPAGTVSNPATTKAHYDAMRKENPSQYFSAKVQKEIHDLAIAGKYQL